MTITGAQSTLARQFVDAIRQVVGPDPVVLHEPCFCGNEWAYLKECLDSTFVSSVGKFVDRFEAGAVVPLFHIDANKKVTVAAADPALKPKAEGRLIALVGL